MQSRRALISVSSKGGIIDFAGGLKSLGWEIVSTGGTARALQNAGIAVMPIEDFTGFPEMMDGRVKTLHPAVHAGLLARRDIEEHMAALAAQGFRPIDLVAVNLYPFRETVARSGVSLEDAIEQIDIGGPSMLRSAAKNHASVLAIVDPTDYPRVLEALKTDTVTPELRLDLAAKVFGHTAGYDAAVSHFLSLSQGDLEHLPPAISLVLERIQPLRYGENPNQRAGLYATDEPRGVRQLTQIHGKELSFNNLLDIDGAALAVAPWTDRPACAIIKHTTPCGIALGRTAADAFRGALATDPTSAFGSVIAYNTVVDAAAAEAIEDLFVEALVAPRFHDEALTVLRRKKNL